MAKQQSRIKELDDLLTSSQREQTTFKEKNTQLKRDIDEVGEELVKVDVGDGVDICEGVKVEVGVTIYVGVRVRRWC